MFNKSLRKDALAVHQNTVDRYNSSYDQMRKACDELYSVRESAVEDITTVEEIVNSIANRPKEFDKHLGDIKQYVAQFRKTQEYAKEAYKEAVKSGVGIFAGVATGGAIATATPKVAMSIATTFGRATTGRAISTLSGDAAQRAALGWIGRHTGGIATKGIITGSGLASGKAFLTLLGGIGWGAAAVNVTVTLTHMTFKNKKLANEVIDEAKEIMKLREIVRETEEKVKYLQEATEELKEGLAIQIQIGELYRGKSYLSLEEDAQLQLGTLVNNTLSLAALLNQVVE